MFNKMQASSYLSQVAVRVAMLQVVIQIIAFFNKTLDQKRFDGLYYAKFKS
jgi:hypothetical protein